MNEAAARVSSHFEGIRIIFINSNQGHTCEAVNSGNVTWCCKRNPWATLATWNGWRFNHHAFWKRFREECDTDLSHLRVVNTRAKIGALFLSMPYIGPLARSGGSPCRRPGSGKSEWDRKNSAGSGEFGRVAEEAECGHSFAGGRVRRTRFGVDALRGVSPVCVILAAFEWRSGELSQVFGNTCEPSI